MNGSKLTDYVIKTAEKICKQANGRFISSACVVTAMAELCREYYQGFGRYETETEPECYEEERVRYAMEKLFFMHGFVLHRALLRRVKKDAALCDEDFLTQATPMASEIAALRGKMEVSADVLLLLAASALEPELHRLLRQEYREEVPIFELLEDIDHNTVDWMISRVGSTISLLEKKKQEALQYLQWPSVTAPLTMQELKEVLQSGVSARSRRKELNMTFHSFFGWRGDLRLTVQFANGSYYVHDNGDVLGFLRGYASEPDALLVKVCHADWVRGDLICGRFSAPRQLITYLQRLVFIAHADLYDVAEGALLYPSDGRFDTDGLRFEEFDPTPLTDYLSNMMRVTEDGVLALDMTYPNNGTAVAYRLEFMEGDHIRISDAAEGSIFENLLLKLKETDAQGVPLKQLVNLRKSPDTAAVRRICDEMSLYFDGMSVSHTFVHSNRYDLFKGIHRFIHGAILLSAVGREISEE